MERKRVLIFSAILIVVVTLLACDTGTFTAFLDAATATPTRTPRPTFTPRATATPEDTATPEPSPTTAVSPTLTPRPTLRPATKAPTAPPPPPPAPKFPVTFVEGYLCDQPNDPIWKITGRVNRTDSNYFLGGYVLGVFASDGRFLKASQPSAENDYITSTIGGNCRVDKVYLSNLDLDVSEFRMQAPLIIRIIKSASDHTPLSADFRATFEQPGNYYLLYHASQ